MLAAVLVGIVAWLIFGLQVVAYVIAAYVLYMITRTVVERLR